MTRVSLADDRSSANVEEHPLLFEAAASHFQHASTVFVLPGLFTRLLTTEIIRLQTKYPNNPPAKPLRVLRDPAGPLSSIAYLAP